MKARRIVLGGLLVGLGAVLHLIESAVIPPLAVPGLKLGLANAVTLVGLVFGGPILALAVAALRPVLGGLLGSGLFSIGFALSLGGALASGLAMSLAWRLAHGSDGAKLSLVGVSLVGGVFHNLGQLAVAVNYVGLSAALSYLAPLLGAGLAAGYIVGRLTGWVAGAAGVRAAFRQYAAG